MSAVTPPVALTVAAVLVAAVVVADHLHRRRRARLLQALGADVDNPGDRVATGLVAVAALFMGLALLGGGGSAPTGPADGADVILLFDVSRSMTVRDAEPDRGAAARRAALYLATEASSTRMGVVAFADDAHALLPPTFDRGLIALYLGALDPSTVSGQGSDLAEAVRVAVETAASERGPAGVVLFSDGEGFQDDTALEEALAEAHRAGVRVHTVCVGTSVGGRIPDTAGDARSSADPAALARISRETGGTAVEASDGAGLRRLAGALRSASPDEEASGASKGGAGEPLAVPPVQWLALAALVALLAEGVVNARRAS